MNAEENYEVKEQYERCPEDVREKGLISIEFRRSLDEIHDLDNSVNTSHGNDKNGHCWKIENVGRKITKASEGGGIKIRLRTKGGLNMNAGKHNPDGVRMAPGRRQHE